MRARNLNGYPICAPDSTLPFPPQLHLGKPDMHGMLMLIAGAVTIVAMAAAVMVGVAAVSYAIGAMLASVF